MVATKKETKKISNNQKDDDCVYNSDLDAEFIYNANSLLVEYPGYEPFSIKKTKALFDLIVDITNRTSEKESMTGGGCKESLWKIDDEACIMVSIVVAVINILCWGSSIGMFFFGMYNTESNSVDISCAESCAERPECKESAQNTCFIPKCDKFGGKCGKYAEALVDINATPNPFEAWGNITIGIIIGTNIIGQFIEKIIGLPCSIKTWFSSFFKKAGGGASKEKTQLSNHIRSPRKKHQIGGTHTNTHRYTNMNSHINPHKNSDSSNDKHESESDEEIMPEHLHHPDGLSKSSADSAYDIGRKNFLKNLWTFLFKTIAGDLDFIIRFIHILFGLVVYFFFSGNTKQVPITMLTYLGVIIMIGYFLGTLTSPPTPIQWESFSRFIYWGLSAILLITSVIMFIVNMNNLGWKLIYDITSEDVMTWWLITLLGIMYLWFGGVEYFFNGSGIPFITSVNTYVDKVFNGSALTLIKIFLVIIGLTFSVYNNLSTACGGNTGTPSGGQNSFLIVFMIIYSVYILLIDLGMLVLNFKLKNRIYKGLCKAETKVLKE